MDLTFKVTRTPLLSLSETNLIYLNDLDYQRAFPTPASAASPFHTAPDRGPSPSGPSGPSPAPPTPAAPSPSPSSAPSSALTFVRVQNRVYLVRGIPEVAHGFVALNMQQRSEGGFVFDAPCRLIPVDIGAQCALPSVSLELDLFGKKAGMLPIQMRVSEAIPVIKRVLGGHVLSDGQSINLRLPVTPHGSEEVKQVQVLVKVRCTPSEGQFLDSTEISLVGDSILLDQGSCMNNLFRSEMDFSRLGIGGLDAEFNRIFRRAFASRIFPSNIVRQLGINHVRGMLLFGPPGCGKTLIARQIGHVLNAKAPKIVNGPEILDRYVGGSEEKIRNLFKDAEEDQQRLGDRSPLHIIIFDELDAICKSRGSMSDSTGVHDSIVNQLLSKIDGVDSLNNILIIGMTNRKDLIDEALLRPGRLELHVEISLPDEAGRLQIINIHTRSMRENRRLSAEAIDHLPELAARTKNYSGAEIEGLIKNAASFAFNRTVDLEDGQARVRDASALCVEWGDLLRALSETTPAFGVRVEELSSYFRGGIIDYGPRFRAVQETLTRTVSQMRTSDRMSLMTVLLHGAHNTGKTALAAFTASESAFPFVRVLSADSLIGVPETVKSTRILEKFNDSYRSPMSVIVLDDMERLIDYSQAGMRYSNSVLQTLLLLLRKAPPEGHKLIVIGTTSMYTVMEQLELSSAFHLSLEVPGLLLEPEMRAVCGIEGLERPFGCSVGIKKLLLMLEMSRDVDGSVSRESLVRFLR